MKKYWNEISVGDYLHPHTKPPISKLQISFFSSAVNEFSPLQMDEDFAKNAGFNSVFACNIYSLGLAFECINKFAKNISIVSLSSTFYKLIWPADRIVAKALIVQRFMADDEYRVGLNVWCENELGEVVMKGTSDILMFKDEQHEKKSSLKTPAVSNKTHQALLEKYEKNYQSNDRISLSIQEIEG